MPPIGQNNQMPNKTKVNEDQNTIQKSKVTEEIPLRSAKSSGSNDGSSSKSTVNLGSNVNHSTGTPKTERKANTQPRNKPAAKTTDKTDTKTNTKERASPNKPKSQPKENKTPEPPSRPPAVTYIPYPTGASVAPPVRPDHLLAPPGVHSNQPPSGYSEQPPGVEDVGQYLTPPKTMTFSPPSPVLPSAPNMAEKHHPFLSPKLAEPYLEPGSSNAEPLQPYYITHQNPDQVYEGIEGSYEPLRKSQF